MHFRHYFNLSKWLAPYPVPIPFTSRLQIFHICISIKYFYQDVSYPYF